MEETADKAMELVVNTLTTYGMSVIGAIVTLIIGWWLANRIRGWINRLFNKRQELDPMLGSFLASFARYLVLAATALAVLAKFGIETTSLIAMLGAAGLAIGLALQGTLSNIAAGVMILIFRPFKVGDFVEIGGLNGTVKAVSLFVTELATADNIQRLVPNSQIWGAAISNYSAHDKRRVDFVFGIGYGADIDKAMAIILELVNADERVHKDPEPFVAVSNLGDSSVDITTRVWANTSDYWGVKFDLTKKVKEAFDAQGIDIPFPTRTVFSVNDTD